jgi:hypothetical protein
MNIPVQQGHAAAWTCNRDMQDRHAVWTYSTGLQRGFAGWTCKNRSMHMNGHVTSSMDIQHGYLLFFYFCALLFRAAVLAVLSLLKIFSALFYFARFTSVLLISFPFAVFA